MCKVFELRIVSENYISRHTPDNQFYFQNGKGRDNVNPLLANRLLHAGENDYAFYFAGLDVARDFDLEIHSHILFMAVGAVNSSAVCAFRL